MRVATSKILKRSPEVIALTALAALACDDVGNGENGGQDTATIEGRVDEDGSQSFAPSQAEGSATVVAAYRVSADGELEGVATGAAEVDAEGRYEVEVDRQAATGASLVLRAEAESDGASVGKVAISEHFDGDASMQAPPIDAESTVIADIFLEARAEGEVSAEVGPGMFWLTVGTGLAAELTAAGEAEIAAAAEAASAAVTAWKATLRHESSAASEQDVSVAMEFSADAEATLAGELAAGNADGALEAYAAAVIDAHADAGVQAEFAARAGIASAEAMKGFEGELGAEGGAALGVAAEAHKARTATEALARYAEENLAAAGGAVADAGASARAEVRAAAQAGAEAQAEIEEAWASLQAEATAEIAATFGLAESEIEAVVEGLEAEVDALASALGDLSGSLSLGGELDVAIEGMATYFAEVSTQAEALVALGIDESEAEAAATVLATIVACQA